MIAEETFKNNFIRESGDIFMSRKGPKVGQGMLDFVEDLRYDVVSH